MDNFQICFKSTSFRIEVKLRFCEKSPKVCEITTLDLKLCKYLVNVKSKVEISENFVASLKISELYLQSFFIVDFVKGLCMIIFEICVRRPTAATERS